MCNLSLYLGVKGSGKKSGKKYFKDAAKAIKGGKERCNGCSYACCNYKKESEED